MTTATFPLSMLDTAASPDFASGLLGAPSKRQQTDAVERAQSGDHEAFAELYEQHKRRVFGICMRMVRDYGLAEDLTQESFLQLHRKITSFRGDSAFATWLHRMTVNIVLMHLRKRALAVVSLDHLMENVPEERAGRSFGARDLVQAGVADRLDIERAIDTMAPGYRSIFLLHDIDGYDHGEIASQLKCTRGNTKSQLHKARRTLRVALTKTGLRGPGAKMLALAPRRPAVAEGRDNANRKMAVLAQNA